MGLPTVSLPKRSRWRPRDCLTAFPKRRISALCTYDISISDKPPTGRIPSGPYCLYEFNSKARPASPRSLGLLLRMFYFWGGLYFYCVILFLFVFSSSQHPTLDLTTRDVAVFPSRSVGHAPTYQPHHLEQTRDLAREFHRGYRDFLYLGAGWNLYYSSWSAPMLPIPPAAYALRRLYTTIVTDGKCTLLKCCFPQKEDKKLMFQ